MDRPLSKSTVLNGTRPSDLPQTIADNIRELISLGAVYPGERLEQVSLAQRYCSSRIPVREALKHLAGEGIVVHDQMRGFFVPPLSGFEARQLFKLHQVLEELALESLSWPNNNQLSHLMGLYADMSVALKKDQDWVWWALYRQLHLTVFGLSSAEVVVGELKRLWSLTDRYRTVFGPPGCLSVDEIISALAGKDRPALIAARASGRNRLRRHIIDSLESVGV